MRKLCSYLLFVNEKAIFLADFIIGFFIVVRKSGGKNASLALSRTTDQGLPRTFSALA